MTKKDIFICHASEDKKRYVEPLIELFKANGISYWYDDNEIMVGEKLQKAIEKGLNSARYCLVVFSADFLSKEWTNRELNMIREREQHSKQTILLPLVEDASEEDIKKEYSFLSSRLFLKWSEQVKLIDHIKKYLSGDETPIEMWCISDFLYQLENIYPILHWIARPIPAKQARRYFCALQELFNGGSIFFEQLDSSLCFAIDLICRVISYDPALKDHYGNAKSTVSLGAIESYLKRYPKIYSKDLQLNEAMYSVESLLDAPYELNDDDRAALTVYFLLLSYLRGYQSKRGYTEPSIEIGRQLYQLISSSISSVMPVSLPKLHDELGWQRVYELTEQAWLGIESD